MCSLPQAAQMCEQTKWSFATVVWFALHVFFAESNLVKRGIFQILIPDLSSAKWDIFSIALVCGILLFWRQWDSWQIIGIAAALGLGLSSFYSS